MSQGRWTPAPDLLDRAQRILRRAVIIDIHTHPQGIIPPVIRRAAEHLVGLPRDPLDNLPASGVNVAVVTAVGDAIGTAWRFQSAWHAVLSQLDTAIEEAKAADISVAADLAGVGPTASPRIILGVEGADFLGSDADRIELLHARGVRVLGLVHFADNRIGTIGSSVTGRARRPENGRSGLTQYGRDVLQELNRLAIVPDLAHADRNTTMAVCEESKAPVISSHTAAGSVRDFPRYISDPEVEAIAATGGVIGLWPAFMRGRAMTDLDDFARHAAYIAELVGTEHLAIGTDKNGVPDYADGYSSSPDFVNLAAALLGIGFGDSDVAAILGGNAYRILGEST